MTATAPTAGAAGQPLTSGGPFGPTGPTADGRRPQVASLPRYIDPVGRRAALVTPDAVALDLPLADVGSRGLAVAIDVFAMAVTGWMVVSVLAIAALLSLPEWGLVAGAIVAQFLVLFAYPVFFEVVANGQTIGKMALGIRVVTVDGGPVTFRHAAIRSVFSLLDLFSLFGLIGLAAMASTRKVQRLGDMAAGTVVIRANVGVRGEDRAVQFPIPPHLHRYAQTLDVAGLDAEDYAILRGFLLRAPRMRSAPRQRAATRLATAYASRLGHIPPPDTHPELFLLCLAGLMQQQDDRRALARQAQQVRWTGPVRAQQATGWNVPQAAG